VWAWAYGGTYDKDARQKLRDAVEQAELAGNRPPVRPEDRGKPHHPGTTPPGIPVPSWYKGDRAAFRTSVRAAQELGEPAALGA
jgi:hypothetical protein